MAAPTAASASAAPPPPPPPRASPAVVSADTAHSEAQGEKAHAPDEDDDEEQREFLLNALDVAGDWSAHDDGDGRIFYYNRRARESQWSPPEGFSGLEGTLMMKLMLESAVARSGLWTAHDAGDGSGALYYFNARTRESVWERPSDWSVLPPPPAEPKSSPIKGAAEPTKDEGVVEDQGRQDAETTTDSKKKKKTKKKRRDGPKKGTDNNDGNAQTPRGSPSAAEAGREKKEEAGEEEEEEEEDPEELEAAKLREEAHMRHTAQFRTMLREKNIMPFCRWSVALPQIAGDPRFMGISTMDERREIFEHFVKHRRDDLKAEKKQKIKQAKKLFEELLADQLQAGWVDAKTTLSVFLAALEDHIGAARYKLLQNDSLAFLTIDVQEKLFAKSASAFQDKQHKMDEQAKQLTAFLEKEMSTGVLSWEEPKTQDLIKAFYASETSSAASLRLPIEKQQHIFRDVAQRLQTAEEHTSLQAQADARRLGENRKKPDSPREDGHRREQDRRRSSSHSRSRSQSRHRASRRDRSEGSGRRRHHSSRGRRRDSRSRSRSRSCSRSRSRRRYRRSRHARSSSSSSRSRSRSRSRRRR